MKSCGWFVCGFVLSMAGPGCSTEPSASSWPPTVAQTAPPAAPEPVPSEPAPSAAPEVPAQEQPEVLARGPVHEAFAEPIPSDPNSGEVVTQQPPSAIDESPPEEMPQGAGYVWVPGYWSWDTDRNDYIWVSGCWRLPPPSQRWVPGYWAQVSHGWAWVPGFWTTADAADLTYLPTPPAAVEVEAPGVAPSPDEVWVPGCWYWYNDRYVLRHGYWLRQQSGWIWTPSHYCWTPHGCVFVGGRWDYALDRRGVLFAPVAFPVGVALRAGFSFSPGITVDMGLVTANLFACPRYGHYYFGDYYDPIYVRAGIFPWFECTERHTWYDPLYVHARWEYGRRDPQWAERERHEYERRRVDRDLRPPRTLREQEVRVARLPEAQRRTMEVVRPVSAVAAARNAPIRLQRADPAARQRVTQEAREVRSFGQSRRQWEVARGAAAPTAPERHEAAPAPERRENAPRRHEVTPAPERREVTPPPERREVTPPPERREITPPPERREVTPPPERREVTPPPERREAPTVRTERHEAPETRAVPEREVPPVHVEPRAPETTDRVRVPPSPWRRSEGVERGNAPPTRPERETDHDRGRDRDEGR